MDSPPPAATPQSSSSSFHMHLLFTILTPSCGKYFWHPWNWKTHGSISCHHAHTAHDGCKCLACALKPEACKRQAPAFVIEGFLICSCWCFHLLIGSAEGCATHKQNLAWCCKLPSCVNRTVQWVPAQSFGSFDNYVFHQERMPLIMTRSWWRSSLVRRVLSEMPQGLAVIVALGLGDSNAQTFLEQPCKLAQPVLQCWKSQLTPILCA